MLFALWFHFHGCTSSLRRSVCVLSWSPLCMPRGRFCALSQCPRITHHLRSRQVVVYTQLNPGRKQPYRLLRLPLLCVAINTAGCPRRLSISSCFVWSTTANLEQEGRPPELVELVDSRFGVGVLVVLVYRRRAALSKAQLCDPLVLPGPWSQHLCWSAQTSSWRGYLVVAQARITRRFLRGHNKRNPGRSES